MRWTQRSILPKNDNTYAKKEADIYMQKKESVLKPIFLIHIDIDI